MFHFFKRKKKNNKKGGDVNVTLEEKLIELTKEGLLTEEELDLIKKNLSKELDAQEENVLIEEINHLRKEVEDLKAQLESSKSIPKKPRIVDSEVNDYGYGTKTIYQK